jgi:hypothetical protein
VRLPLQGAHHPGHRRCPCRSRHGHGLRQDHPGPRSRRLRGGRASRPRADRRDERGRDHERGRARAIPGVGPLRVPRARTGGAGSPGSAPGDARPRPGARPQLPQPGTDRVPPVRSVVRADEAARGEGARGERVSAQRRGVGSGRGREPAPPAPRALREALPPLADEHP